MTHASQLHTENANQAPREESSLQAQNSVSFLKSFDLPQSARIMDAGGGDVHLAEALLEMGFEHISVLDRSASMIEQARKRLAGRAKSVSWIIANMTNFEPFTFYDFWHDRTALHLLDTQVQLDRYVQLVRKAVAPNGYLVICTSAAHEPQKGGTNIDAVEKMTELLEPYFERLEEGQEQEAGFCSFRRKAEK